MRNKTRTIQKKTANKTVFLFFDLFDKQAGDVIDRINGIEVRKTADINEIIAREYKNRRRRADKRENERRKKQYYRLKWFLFVKHNDNILRNISTYIFDEIDAGISGFTATTVAEKFVKISESTQILAVSHLPQVVSRTNSSILLSLSSALTFVSVFPPSFTL